MESHPSGKKTKEKQITTLEWKCSLSQQQNYPIKLVYGIKTNAKLTNFITGVGTSNYRCNNQASV